MAESSQKRLSRVRKPRVHITYEVDNNGEVEQKELPFVVGVLGDYCGNNPGEKQLPLRDRKFIQIDRDNFNDVMARIRPGLTFRVENTLEKGASEIPINLEFNKMEDFEPAAVVNKVEPLRKMLESRNKLRDLLAKADTSSELQDKLEEILATTKALEGLSNELGASSEPASPEPEEEQ